MPKLIPDDVYEAILKQIDKLSDEKLSLSGTARLVAMRLLLENLIPINGGRLTSSDIKAFAGNDPDVEIEAISVAASKAFNSLLKHLSNEYGGIVVGKHNGVPWFYVDDMAPEAVGFIPSFLREDDARPIIEQINERYISGWNKFEGFQLMKKSWTIKYAGDPPLQPIAGAALHGEIIVVYPLAWVMVVKENNSYEIARMD